MPKKSKKTEHPASWATKKTPAHAHHTAHDHHKNPHPHTVHVASHATAHAPPAHHHPHEASHAHAHPTQHHEHKKMHETHEHHAHPPAKEHTHHVTHHQHTNPEHHNHPTHIHHTEHAHHEHPQHHTPHHQHEHHTKEAHHPPAHHQAHMHPHLHHTTIPAMHSHQHAHESAKAAHAAYSGEILHDLHEIEKQVKHAANPPTEQLLKKMAENMVLLQKIQVTTAERFDSLAKQMMALLALFESAAKAFTTNPQNPVAQKDKDFLDKIDTILEQNKLLARGLSMVEEKMRGGPLATISTGPTRPMVHEVGTDPSREKIYPSTEKKEEDGSYEPSINKPLPKF